jgi:hypothetical protein
MIVTKVKPITKNKLRNTTLRNKPPAAVEFESHACNTAYRKETK